jgi:hypothetical protein
MPGSGCLVGRSGGWRNSRRRRCGCAPAPLFIALMARSSRPRRLPTDLRFLPPPVFVPRAPARQSVAHDDRTRREKWLCAAVSPISSPIGAGIHGGLARSIRAFRIGRGARGGCVHHTIVRAGDDLPTDAGTRRKRSAVVEGAARRPLRGGRGGAIGRRAPKRGRSSHALKPIPVDAYRVRLKARACHARLQSAIRLATP